MRTGVITLVMEEEPGFAPIEEGVAAISATIACSGPVTGAMWETAAGAMLMQLWSAMLTAKRNNPEEMDITDGQMRALYVQMVGELMKTAVEQAEGGDG